jgi:ribonuclease HII
MLFHERRIWAEGCARIAGIDEAGVGPLAGPVVAAAVILSPDLLPDGIDDSKRLSPKTRDRLADELSISALAIGVGLASVKEIDALNIYQASLLAMRRAVEALSPAPHHLLIDARRLSQVPIRQTSLVKGDQLSISIAAASIIAKTRRDRIMAELDQQYPGYGFRVHMGYPTSQHREALRRLGPCPAHRHSFPSVREFSESPTDAYRSLLGQLNSVQEPGQIEMVRSNLRDCRGTLSPAEYRRLSALLRRLRKEVSSQGLLPGFEKEV